MSTQNIFQDQIDSQTPDFLKKSDAVDGLIEMPEYSESAIEQADSLGALFRQARLAKSLEPKDVASRLKVSPSIIQSLESNLLEQLGPPVFVRNHLKRYAQLLNLPEQEVLERYRALGLDSLPPLKVAHPVKQQTRVTDLRWISYPLIAIVVIWLGWLGLERLSSHLAFSGNISIPGISANDGDNNSVTLPGQDSGSPGAAPTANADSSTDSDEASRSLADGDLLELPQPSTETIESPQAFTPTATNTETAEEDATTASDDTTTTLPTETASADDSATATEGTSVEANPLTTADSVEANEQNSSTEEEVAALDERPENFHELIMQFSDDCWVEVKDANGERLAYGIIKANSVRTLNGETPFSVTLGNANAAQLKLDGETIDKSVYLSSSRGGVARFKIEPPTSG